MGEAILSICHPDSITTIKHWNTIIKARFEEVSAQLLSGRYTSHMCGIFKLKNKIYYSLVLGSMTKFFFIIVFSTIMLVSLNLAVFFFASLTI